MFKPYIRALPFHMFEGELLIFVLASSYPMQGSGGVTIKKTGQALVFGVYDEPVTPGQCNMIVERLGDYLIEQGL